MDQQKQCKDFLHSILKNQKQINKDIINDLKINGHNIKYQCKNCLGDQNGYYTPKNKEIVICSNKVKIMYDVIDTINHELVHAYDDCVNKLNWKNIDEVVCSEIKASFHSQCQDKGYNMEELFECVKRGATISSNSKETVEKLMPKCFNQNYKFKL